MRVRLPMPPVSERYCFGEAKMRARTKRKPDPLIDEIRAIRKTIHDEFGGDIAKTAKHANAVAQKYRMQKSSVTRTKTTGKK